MLWQIVLLFLRYKKVEIFFPYYILRMENYTRVCAQSKISRAEKAIHMCDNP